MKKLLITAISLSIFFGLNLTACAQNKAVDKATLAELTKIYLEFDESTKNLDVKAIEKYLDENYLIESGKEKVNKQQVLERIKALNKAILSTRQ